MLANTCSIYIHIYVLYIYIMYICPMIRSPYPTRKLQLLPISQLIRGAPFFTWSTTAWLKIEPGSFLRCHGKSFGTLLSSCRFQPIRKILVKLTQSARKREKITHLWSHHLVLRLIFVSFRNYSLKHLLVQSTQLPEAKRHFKVWNHKELLWIHCES